MTEVPIGLNIDLNISRLMKVLCINVKTALYSKEDTTQQASHAYTCYNKTTRSHKEILPKARRGSTHTIFKRSSADFSRVFNEVVETRRKMNWHLRMLNENRCQLRIPRQERKAFKSKDKITLFEELEKEFCHHEWYDSENYWNGREIVPEVRLAIPGDVVGTGKDK